MADSSIYDMTEAWAQVDKIFEPARKKIKEDRALAIKARVEDMTAVLSTEAGKRVLWWILEEAHIFNSNFTGQSNTTIFREGERNIGLKLLHVALLVDSGIMAKLLDAQITKEEQ